MQAETSLNAKRVAQIDAHSLDQILISYFRNKLDEIFLLLFSNGDHAKWRRYWDFYLRPCLVPVLYYAPRIFTGYTPGQRMMNVTFNKQHWKLKNALVHYGFAVLFPSFLRILSETSRHKAFEQCENIFRFLGLIHFFVFLIHGGPFSLIERFLGVRTIHVEPPKLGLLNFFDLNRELIAHFLGHVVLFFLPGFVFASNIYKRWLIKLKSNKRPLEKITFPTKEPLLVCAECKQSAIIPVISRCEKNCLLLLLFPRTIWLR